MNWFFGDNINTDLITPGRYNVTTDTKVLASIAFIEYRPKFAKKVKMGDFLIAGENFGCGSSRETAVFALKQCGLKAILAKSFARIFYRNCLNNGLLAIVVNTDDIKMHDKLIIDVTNNVLANKTKKTTKKIIIPSIMKMLVEEGGIIPYLQKNGLEKLSELGKFQWKL